MWDTIRYRRLQALTIAVLAALVTTCVVVAPLYDRATQQALTRIELEHATVAVRGLSVSAGAENAEEAPPDPGDVAASVPRALRARFEPPIRQQTAQPDATAAPTGMTPLVGELLSRDAVCRHVRMVQGSCPTGARQIAVSTFDAKLLGLVPGTAVVVSGATESGGVAHHVTMHVVGVYRQVRGAYWFGQSLTGRSGLQTGDSSSGLLHDDWVTAAATYTDPRVPVLPLTVNRADLGLQPHTMGVDELLASGSAISRLVRRYRSDPGFSAAAFRLYSGLPGIAANMRHQREQSQVTIPLLTVQLGVLAVVVLWLVLGAATEQRRPEVAVAVLRGRGRSGARSLLLRELLPVALAGVPLGIVAALVLTWLARTRLLPGSAPFEIRLPVVLAVAASVVVLCVVVVLVVLGATRRSVEQLLRRVPARRSGWSVGVTEALLLAAGGTAVVAFVTGGLDGPIALAAPALLALVVGMLLAHATTPVATALGRRLLRRGRVAASVSVLDAARTPATRRTIAIVTVATSLLVFASAAVLVGGRNRSLAAEQEAGASLTADVYGDDLRGVQAAVRQVDPTQRRLTTVVSVTPAASGAQQTIAVDPAAFERVGLFAGRSSPPDLSGLTPRAAVPLTLTGDAVSVTVATDDLASRAAVERADGRPATAPVSLALDLLTDDNEPVSIDLGALGLGTSSRAASALVPCSRTCHLVGVSLGTNPGATVSGTVSLSGLTSTTGGGDPTTVAVGPAGRWRRLDERSKGSMTPVSTTPTSLSIVAETKGSDTTTMTQQWLPTSLPALVTRGRGSTVAGLDGQDRAAHAVGRIARIPQAGPYAALVDLDLAARGSTVDPTDQIQVWFAHDDPALLTRLSRALAQREIRLSSHTSLAEVRRTYDQSTAAWSLALGVVVGVAALLLGLLVVVVMAVTTWRTRSRDLAALRLAGLGRRTVRSVATRAQVPALVLAVLAGTLCGAEGARLTLPTVPLFAHAPDVSTLDLRLPWWAIATVAVAALVLLIAVGWAAGAAIARRADLQRVRETL
ncbi:FtsX-like permease family protein [Nocardioides mangrovicus]|uniref:FtsX-like permease family protein n=1 Tax=Nocardioides mangrovicus TaxID=2478913 RepID=A0A3L8P2P0_9ACTN|nr:FtsX-like permease family protein [Nocardioides mangrovicus]RLV49321.1 FtsX-like permease family protein [Nocardioides mangrovicus]